MSRALNCWLGLQGALRGRVMALYVVRAAVMACAGLIGWPVCFGGPSAGAADPKVESDELKLEIETQLMSDYIYRGVSLSARRPSVAMSIDAEWHGFYTNTNFQSVKLPTQPAAEITLSGGYRWSFADFKFDLGANYFYYPRQIPIDTTTSTSYWEYALQVDRQVTDKLDFRGQVGYSPNVSNTGAWGVYSEAGVAIELPRLDLLRNMKWELSADVGHWRFGNTSPAQGGVRLPAYTTWHVRLQFKRTQHLNLDLNYYHTNPSRENCFFFTRDRLAPPRRPSAPG